LLTTIAQRLNQHHWNEGEETRRKYVTALFLRLDGKAGKLECVNAVHNPGFLIKPDQDTPTLLESSGTPLGMLPGKTYSSETHDFIEIDQRNLA
jgi:sigma-B regulation protein RsbU (phosphoserine phosphatase)